MLNGRPEESTRHGFCTYSHTVTPRDLQRWPMSLLSRQPGCCCQGSAKAGGTRGCVWGRSDFFFPKKVQLWVEWNPRMRRQSVNHCILCLGKEEEEEEEGKEGNQGEEHLGTCRPRGGEAGSTALERAPPLPCASPCARAPAPHTPAASAPAPDLLTSIPESSSQGLPCPTVETPTDKAMGCHHQKHSRHN